jgi:hypothetical protein
MELCDMTSKRLGSLLFILAFAWSVAGLGWFTPWLSEGPDAILGVGAAQADPPVWDQLVTTYTVDGDPDAFANSPSGDSTQLPAPSDSTSTAVTSTPSRVSPVLRVILAAGSAISGIFGWS